MMTSGCNTKAFVGLFLYRPWQVWVMNYTPCSFLIKMLLMKGNKTPPLLTRDTRVVADTGCSYGRKHHVLECAALRTVDE
jgi:hypothetical protein